MNVSNKKALFAWNNWYSKLCGFLNLIYMVSTNWIGECRKDHQTNLSRFYVDMEVILAYPEAFYKQQFII